MPEVKTYLEAAREHVAENLTGTLPRHHLFHNYSYGQEVAEIAAEIGEAEGVSEEESTALQLAALFFSSGYANGYENPYERSAAAVEKFLSERGADSEQIARVKRLIMSLRDGHQPIDLPEAIIQDAYYAYLGRKRFDRYHELQRIEEETALEQEYSDYEWQKRQYDKLIDHRFHTATARAEYEDRRAKNISSQRKNVQKAYKNKVRVDTGKEFGRGIDTMYRTAYRNHINLSAIADGKANMMISINAIIISVLLALSGAGFTFSETIKENFIFSIPLMLLLLGALVSVVFAILSARPSVTENPADENVIEDETRSILYFGTFLSFPIKKFVRKLSTIKHDQNLIYDNMSTDMYYLGVVLQKKYRLLTFSYNAFMAGLVLSVIAAIVIFILT